MGEMIQFTRQTKAADVYKDFKDPPDCPIEGAHWISSLLRYELATILADPTIPKDEKRLLILKYARAINVATPNEELWNALQKLRAEERKDTASPTLQGEVTERAAKSKPGRLRSN